MSYQKTFRRYELKYMLTKEQKEDVLKAIEPYMSLDKYGISTIKNLYFDTPDYRLIRRSMEKPDYKEKLRIRSYRNSKKEQNVFVEIKKKYEKVVYKRRIAMPEDEAIGWLCEGKRAKEGQIISEIEYFMDYYGTLAPVLFLSYDREAFYAKDGGDFRITFDYNVACRQDNLCISDDASVERILDEDKVLMEIKCSGGIPIWMTDILSKNKLYKTSFSKYGTAYRKVIYPKLRGKEIDE